MPFSSSLQPDEERPAGATSSVLPVQDRPGLPRIGQFSRHRSESPERLWHACPVELWPLQLAHRGSSDWGCCASFSIPTFCRALPMNTNADVRQTCESVPQRTDRFLWGPDRFRLNLIVPLRPIPVQSNISINCSGVLYAAISLRTTGTGFDAEVSDPIQS